MHEAQHPYRLLVDDLWRAEAPVYSRLLGPWLKDHPGEREWLAAFRARVGDPVPSATIEDLWRLYALSRVFEMLLLRFQVGPSDRMPNWEGPPIDPDELRDFATAIGVQVEEVREFHPFDHEVVAVEPVDGRGVLEVVAHVWPRFMLGPMMVVRGGVRVRASADQMSPWLAARSTLYWAWLRRLRPTDDLSHGWGSNSQWRTSFRRDYRFGSLLVFNADGELDLGAPGLQEYPDHRDRSPRDERVELLVNRSMVLTGGPHDEFFPFDDHLTLDEAVIARAGATWRLGDWP